MEPMTKKCTWKPFHAFRPWLSAGYMIQRDATVDAIGVRAFATKNNKVFRVFYPGERLQAKEASWFRISFASMLDGYLHTYCGMVGGTLQKGGTAFELFSFFVRMFMWFYPLRNAKIPDCYEGIKPKQSEKIPLLLWSHGLTGNGDESSLLAAALAADGNVVAILTHTDESSSKVDFGESTRKPMYYRHPDLKNYDKAMRMQQIEHRASEIEEVRQLLLSGEAGADLRDLIDPTRIALGGFSFGAATSAHIAATNPSAYRCALLVDGWFHVELKSRGISMDQPASAHKLGINIPCLFIGSAEFQGYRALADATARLYGKCAAAAPDSEFRILPGTRHQNFCDLVWWAWAWPLRASGAIGTADPYAAYMDYVVALRDFMRKHCK